MKITSAFFMLVIFASCSSSEKANEPLSKTEKPILKTKKIAQLAPKEKNIVRKAILADIQLYTESCEPRKSLTSELSKIVFVKIFGKNPSDHLLNLLNEEFESAGNIKAAKDGIAIFKSFLLLGYRDSHDNHGYLISISSLDIKNDSTALINLSQSFVSLGGVNKTYTLHLKGSEWIVSECRVNSYN